MRKYLAIKVGLLLSLVFLLVAVFGWDLLQDMKQLQNEASVIEESNHRSHKLHAIEMEVSANIKTVNDFLITGDHRLREKFQQQQTQLGNIITQYGMMFQDTSVESLLGSVQRIKAMGDQVFQLSFATENMEGPILVNEITKESDAAIQLLAEKQYTLDIQGKHAMKMVEGLRTDMREETIALLAILLLAMGFLTFFIYSKIVLPLTQMKKAVHRVGEGEFDVHCKIISQDEIGELGAAFNAMGEALQEREHKLNRARSLAAHQDKMNAMGVMSAGIAHELGNPLASIAMLLQIILRKHNQQDANAVKQNLNAALGETERMETIIQTVLHFGRYDAVGKFHFFQVQPIVEDAIRLAKMSPTHKRVSVSVDVEVNIPPAYASESMLLQVLINLVYNAFNACKSSGEISIRLFTQGDIVMLDVCDSGHGIPNHLRGEIFKPSFTTKPEGEGTGLGLAISKELIHGMHGSLELIENKQRTCFRICLPSLKNQEAS